jgi:hypothetical protein
MSQADHIISKFGGINPCAKKTGRPVSTVQGWKERGFIHRRNWDGLLESAKEHSIPLTMDDFLDPLREPTVEGNMHLTHSETVPA